MKPTPVHRFVFSQEEVIAALFPSGIPCSLCEIRVEGDEVTIDFVNPALDAATSTGAELPTPSTVPLPADQPIKEQKFSPGGPNELEAIDLCQKKAFHAFLEVKTPEAARNSVLSRTKSDSFSQFDDEKYKRTYFRDLVAEFEAWLLEG